MTDKYDFDIGSEALKGVPGKLLRNVVWFFAISTIARFLGASGVGTFTFLFTIVKTAEVFTRGFGEALKKRMSEAGADDSEHVGVAVVLYSVFVVATSVLTVLVIESPVVPLPVSSTVAYAVLFAHHAYGLHLFSMQIYAAVGEPAESIWLEPLSRSLIFGVQLVLLWSGHEVVGLLVGVFLGALVSGLVGFALVGVVPSSPSRETVRDVFSFAKWSLPGEALGAAYKHSDILVVYVLLGASSLGYFGAAANIVLIGALIGPSIAQPLIVKVSRNHSTGEPVRPPLSTGLAFAGILSLPTLAISLAVPEIMPEVFGESFRGAGYVLILTAAYSCVSVYRHQLAAVLNGIDRPRVPTVTRFIQFVIYVPTVVALTYSNGLMGALVGSLAVELIGFAVLAFATRRHVGPFFDYRTIGAQVAASAILIPLARVAYVTVGGILGVSVAVTVSTLAYLAFTALLSRRLRDGYRAYFDAGKQRFRRLNSG